MDLKKKKKMAAELLKCSKKKIVFDTNSLDEIKEAITKIDIKNLMKKKKIMLKDTKRKSNVRARIRKIQRRKGRQRGFGSRKGKKTARLSRKRIWINRIRIQRWLLKKLRNDKSIDNKIYQDLYLKAKGGFFRSRKHIMFYLDENRLLIKEKVKGKNADSQI